MNEVRSRNIENIVEAVRRSRQFLVATHVRPDGDAAGSVLALSFMLRSLGKKAQPYTRDPLPPSLEFLTGSGEILHEVPDPSLYEVAILVDCGDLERVGPEAAEHISRVPFLINIDHHVSKAPFGNICWVEPTASSTCEMLYDLSLHLPLSLDPDIASQLYTGLVTDTGSFRFSNTNQRVLEIATALVAAGARPDVIAEQIYDSESPRRLLLLAQVLSTVAFSANDRVATAVLSQQMFQETDTTPMDSEGFINHLRSVKSVMLAMIFREDNEGVIHVSMRSKGSVDVAAFAQKHGGGGHRRAAAFRASGPLEAMRAALTAEASSYLK